ncbi:transcription antiterminator lacT, partial [Lacticaseibacillus rhamnosus MTCC 5462]
CAEVANELEQNYPRSYQIASEIFDEIKDQLYRNMSEDERLYFIIHIQRLINEAPAHDQNRAKIITRLLAWRAAYAHGRKVS